MNEGSSPHNIARKRFGIYFMAKKKNTFGINTYVKTTKKKIGRHKKRLNKSEKRSYKKYNRQGK